MLNLPTAHEETPSLEELQPLVRSLAPDQAPGWGSMNATQMLAHCRDFHRLCLGELRPPRPTRFLARMLGPLFLRKFLRGSPFESPKNLRTLAEIRADAASAEEFDQRKDELLDSMSALERVTDGHRHPLYGPMRGEDVRAIARHHLAHHLHQFGLIGPKGRAPETPEPVRAPTASHRP
jgi:hypothetical protein